MFTLIKKCDNKTAKSVLFPVLQLMEHNILDLKKIGIWILVPVTIDFQSIWNLIKKLNQEVNVISNEVNMKLSKLQSKLLFVFFYFIL